MHKIIHDRMGYVFVFGAAATTVTMPICNNGEVKAVAVGTRSAAGAASFTNAVTAQVSITDPLPQFTGYNVNLYTSAQVANNLAPALVAGEDITAGEKGSILVDKTYTMTVTLSGVPGGSGGNVLVVLYFKH